MGRIPLRDDHGRWAGSMSDGNNKSARQRLLEYYQHTGRDSHGVPLYGPGSKGWQLVKDAGNIDDDKVLAKIFARMRGTRK